MRNFPLYDLLSQKHKELYDKSVRIQTFGRGEAIHSHSGSCLGILRILSGVVSINMISDEGREVTLFRLRDGDCFALSAACVLKNVSFDAIIEAETDTTVEILPSHVLLMIIAEDKAVECEMYRITSNRFSDILTKLQQVMFRSVDSRVAEFLVGESKIVGDVITLTHEQIAKNTGSSREVISRMLKRFEDDELVSLGRGTVKIVDRAGLAALI